MEPHALDAVDLVILVVLAGTGLAWRDLRRRPMPLRISSLHGLAGIGGDRVADPVGHALFA